jgi:hypothetical protein
LTGKRLTYTALPIKISKDIIIFLRTNFFFEIQRKAAIPKTTINPAFL